MGDNDNTVAEDSDSEATKQPSEEPTKIEEPEEEKKKDDVEKLRKVIKVDNNSEKKEENNEPLEIPSESGDQRENLEQKRAILQSIKDFDFQIKKNQEELTSLNSKLDSVSKDLDDLVSLYEIVSEQMNPFVGLSKVTKKRLDALENFTREIDVLKERTDELESFAERSGAKLKRIAEGDQPAKTIDTDSLLETGEVNGEIEADPNDTAEESAEIKEEIPVETIEKIPETFPAPEPDMKVENVDDANLMKSNDVEIRQQIITDETVFEGDSFQGLSDADIDIIFEKAFGTFSPEGKIDMIIDEFIESLKD